MQDTRVPAAVDLLNEVFANKSAKDVLVSSDWRGQVTTDLDDLMDSLTKLRVDSSSNSSSSSSSSSWDSDINTAGNKLTYCNLFCVCNHFIRLLDGCAAYFRHHTRRPR